MLDVVDDRLVVESKGIYSIENYLTSRRLMYWQVYLHKTAVACEKVLINTLRRAKYLTENGEEVFAPPALQYFLKHNVDATWFATHSECLEQYQELDDNDVWCALKVWTHHSDRILNTLANDMINRNIFQVEVHEQPIEEERIEKLRHSIAEKMDIDIADTDYLISWSEVQKDMYDVEDDSIDILYKDGSVKDISEASELLNVQLLSKKIRKYYLCYQRI